MVEIIVLKNIEILASIRRPKECFSQKKNKVDKENFILDSLVHKNLHLFSLYLLLYACMIGNWTDRHQKDAPAHQADENEAWKGVLAQWIW